MQLVTNGEGLVAKAEGPGILNFIANFEPTKPEVNKMEGKLYLKFHCYSCKKKTEMHGIKPLDQSMKHD